MATKSVSWWSVGLAGVGTSAAGLYLARRRLLGQVLGLFPARYGVKAQYKIPVTMPDGVRLMTDHYWPTQAGTYPTVLIRSPYGRGSELGRFSVLGWLARFICQRFAERGYHVVTQSVRGRFDSEGTFDAMVEEGGDGAATAEWVKGQPWFNGQLAMYGSSYLGNVQWAIAARAPGALAALAPSITGSQFYTLINRNGVYALDVMLRWLYLVEILDNKGRLSEWQLLQKLGAAQVEQKLRPAFKRLPLADMDEYITGHKVTYYQEWMSGSDRSYPYWARQDYSTAVERVAAPVNLVSGWYDMLLLELLTDYEALRKGGHNPYLLIGPWTHTNPTLAGVTIREALAWFEAHLKGNRQHLREKPVRLFVMGADEWRDLASWPPPAKSTRYYLQPGHKLAPTLPTNDVPSDHYRYDPANPTPALGGALFQGRSGSVDNRPLEARLDVLTYTTPPLDQDLEVIGLVTLELFVKSSLAHTDFFGRLCDVTPAGASLNVCDGLLRVKPGSVQAGTDGALRVEIELSATAYRFQKGHSLRVQVSSGAHPRWNRNLGTGEPEATATRMQAAEQTIFHDEAHASAIVLPVSGL